MWRHSALGWNSQRSKKCLRDRSNIDASASSHYRGKALQAIASTGDLEIVQHLLCARGGVSAVASPIDARTALHAAAEEGGMRFVGTLIEIVPI